MLHLISILRAVVEMLGLCLLGQAVLYLISGRNYAANPIYQLFSLITRRPRRLVACFLPSGTRGSVVAMVCWLILFALWIGLSFLRTYI